MKKFITEILFDAEIMDNILHLTVIVTLFILIILELLK